jgi:drug/metabolite transporter (DMT)-like permease
LNQTKPLYKSSTARAAFIIGVVCTLLGAVGFSTKAIFVKLAYRDSPIDTTTLLALRMLFALPFFLFIAIVASRKSSSAKKLTRKEWWAVIGLGLLGYYISSLLDFLGLKYISAGLERLILFLNPTMVVLISFFFYKKPVSKTQTISLLLAYLGIAIAFIADVRIHYDIKTIYGALLVFGCAISFAIYLTGTGNMVERVGTLRFTSYAMLAATVGVLTHYFIADAGRLSILHQSFTTGKYAFFMAVFATVLPSLLMSEGVKRIGSNNMSIIASIGPVFTIFQASIFLHEPFNIYHAIGTALVLSGVLMLSWKGARGNAIHRL